MNLESEPPQPERKDFFNCVEEYYGGGSFHFSKPGMQESAEYQKYIKDFFHNEPCPYNHEIYQHATAIYHAMRHLVLGLATQELSTSRKRKKRELVTSQDPVEIPKDLFKSANEKRLSFSLVFQTLKYQKFLQEMLTKSKFFDVFPELEDQFSCIMVILCDYQKRKFQRRLAPPGETVSLQMVRIEDALEKCKTRLHAALAKSRISARVPSLDSLLPDSVRKNDKIGSNMNIACWINSLKSSFSEVHDILTREGFAMVDSDKDLKSKTFLPDKHCTDVLFFPHNLVDYLESLSVVKKKALVIQDKSSSVGPHSVCCLMNDGDDIIHINVGAGITTAHLASLIHGFNGSIFAFGIKTENQQRQCLRNLELFGAKGLVRVVNEKFTDVELTDSRFKDIKIVLITANCTRSGVPNPVNFIVSEGEDTIILRDLSFGSVDCDKILELTDKNMAILKHALQFPRVQTIVFCTRSLNDSENEAVVNASIDYMNTVQQTRSPFRVSPPVLPLSDVEIESEVPLSGKFLKFPPSQFSSGCFVAIISREADDPKEAAKGILARAAARGIISGISGADNAQPQKIKEPQSLNEASSTTKPRRAKLPSKNREPDATVDESEKEATH